MRDHPYESYVSCSFCRELERIHLRFPGLPSPERTAAEDELWDRADRAARARWVTHRKRRSRK